MEIRRDEAVGRYAVAARHLSPGEVIFAEVPFAVGPKAGSPVVCLGCHTPLATLTLCGSCGWPVCGERCATMPVHADSECGVFSRASVRFQGAPDLAEPCPQYECVAPLRLLLAKETDRDRWEAEVRGMEAHDVARRGGPLWKCERNNVVDYLRGPCKLAHLFDEALVHTACGILETNAFEARSVSGFPIRCLYPRLAVLSHSCVSNIVHSVLCTGGGDRQDFGVTVRAAVEVDRGEELFSSYTYSLWPTLVRREHLRNGKYFECRCVRCSDPTELGTHMSSVKCGDCTEGHVQSTAPLDRLADWTCRNCGCRQSCDDVRSVFSLAHQEIDAAERSGGTDSLEALLEKYGRLLHPQHAYCCLIKFSLVQRWDGGGATRAGRKAQLCRELLEVLDTVEPGNSRARGMVLYELYRALIVNDTCVLDLSVTLGILRESVSILQTEPANSTEGKTARSAKYHLLLLEKNLAELGAQKVAPSQVLQLQNL